MRNCLKLVLLLHVFLFSAPVVAQAMPDDLPTIVSESSLVMVDVISYDPKTGRPSNNMKREEFEILDNGKAVPISTFDAGAQFQTRPVNLWMVVQCHYREWPETKASGYFQGTGALFARGLEYLDKTDRVGIAHWCDDGTATLDLLPTTDRAAVVKKFDSMFEPVHVGTPRLNRDGELAFQKLLRAIVTDTRKSKPQALPVAIILHDDVTGMPQREADKVIDEILETSGFVYGIRDRRSPVPESYPGEISGVFHYFAEQTGGEYLSASSDQYAAAFVSILQQLHFRYQLGFRPPLLDGKLHKVKVQLTDIGKQQHKGVRLSFRSAYLAEKRRSMK